MVKNMENIIVNILKKDKLEQLKMKAINGDEISQITLGEIYFYGINTDDAYWRNLERTVAMLKYSKKKNITNFAFTCTCNQKPDCTEALKWYEMAALSGNIDAQSKIKAIQNGTQINTTGSLMQIFKCD